MENLQSRLRVNFKVNAKNQLTPDITSEATDPETVQIQLKQGLEILKQVCRDEGFIWPVPGKDV